MKTLLKAISYASLAVLVVAPILLFLGKLAPGTNKHIMLACTIVWFLTAPFWMKTKSGA